MRNIPVPRLHPVKSPMDAASHRRRGSVVLATAVSVAALTALSACSSSASNAGTSTTSSGSKVITVALSEILSGPLSAYGSLQYGTLAAFRYIDSVGGVNGYTFKTSVVDNAYSGPQTISTARSAVLGDHAQILIIVGTTPFEAIKSVASSLPAIILANGDRELLNPAITNLFTLNPDYRQKSSVDIQLMAKLGLKKMAVAYEPDGAGDPVEQTAGAYAKEDGVADVGTVSVPATTTNFAPFAAKLKATGATAVMAGLGTAQVAGLQKAAAAINYEPKWFEDWSALTSSYTSTVGPALAQDMYAFNYEFPDSEIANPAVKLYVTEMKKYYPSQATELDESGWDQGMAAINAVKEATANGGKPSLANLEKALKGLKASGTLVTDGLPGSVISSSVADIFTYNADGSLKVVATDVHFQPLPAGS